jgi:hypothetical protein
VRTSSSAIPVDGRGAVSPSTRRHSRSRDGR